MTRTFLPDLLRPGLVSRPQAGSLGRMDETRPDPEWRLVGPAPATLLHAYHCGAKNLREAEGAELLIERRCLRCEARSQGPQTKPPPIRDFAEVLRDRADLSDWLRARQEARRYGRQVARCLASGEVAEG